MEPREAERAELSIAFEAAPLATVAMPSDIARFGTADIVFSAAEDAFGLMRDEHPRGEIASLFGPSTRLLICAPAPSAFADFAFGLGDGWFDRGKSVEFPVGRLASADDWHFLLNQLPLDDIYVARHGLADGPVISVEAFGRGPFNQQAGARQEQSVLVVLAGGADFDAEPTPQFAVARLDGDADKDRETLAAALTGFGHADVNLIYIPDAVFGDGSDWLRANLMRLAMIARTLSAHATAGAARTDVGKRLAVVLGTTQVEQGEAAALHAAASHAGLWAFMRVLRNECEAIEAHILDLSGASDRDLVAQVERTLALLGAGSDNREWAIDTDTGNALEVRIVPGPMSEAQETTRDFVAATVRQSVPSHVASIAWQACAVGEPGPDEVLIEVAATGLNFRDVMWAMGMLPEEALEDGFAGPAIGMECAGRVVAVGTNVTELAIGNMVMAVAPAAFSTHVRVKQSGVALLPRGIDPVAGATLPVAFLTAYYAIVEMARIRPGETILIHGGAGGVGLAAMQVAKARGATVIATAGSTEKRRLLETLGADHVFNSRTLNFVEEVLAVTDQAGVDVVLNSLFSDAMERSLSLLRPFGRFLELGKRDFYADTKIGLRPFRRNISYFGIDADQLLNTLPEQSARLLGGAFRSVRPGQAHAPPLSSLPARRDRQRVPPDAEFRPYRQDRREAARRRRGQGVDRSAPGHARRSGRRSSRAWRNWRLRTGRRALACGEGRAKARALLAARRRR